MESAKELSNRVREVILSGTWIAHTNYKDILEKINYQEATQTVSSLNTIAMLAYHINYYIEGINEVFMGGDLEIRDTFSFDLPPLKAESDWGELRNRLYHNAEKFAQYVERMSENQLNASFVDEKYGSYRRNIEGVIEHSYYHLGQLSLLVKMIKRDYKI